MRVFVLPDHIHAGLENSILECIVTEFADAALYVGAFGRMMQKSKK